MNIRILRLEGLFAFLLAVAFYFKYDGNWLIFAFLLFVPDISIAGYLRDTRVGAVAYNLVHNLVSPFALLLVGELIDNNFLIWLGLIHAAHVGMDRALGFGLKEKTGFKDTHLGRIGK